MADAASNASTNDASTNDTTTEPLTVEPSSLPSSPSPPLLQAKAPPTEAKNHPPPYRRWLRGLLIAALVIGITLRFANIAPKHKAISLAEANTALHLSGHSLSDLRLAMASQQPNNAPENNPENQNIETPGIENQALKRFQRIPILGDRVTFWRIVSGLCSLLCLPAAWQLGRSLFADPAVSMIALSLLAVSPLQWAFAQEAQPATVILALILAGQTLLIRTAKPKIWRKNWPRYLSYGLGLALVAGILRINPWSSVSVATLLLEITLYWLIALALNRLVQTRQGLAVGALGLLLLGAIALNTVQVMSFSGWLKGPANGNLALAEVLRRHPGPIISDARSSSDLRAILSLSHHLSDDTRWIFPTAANPSLPKVLNTAEEPTYLYRPSNGLTNAIRATSNRPLQPLRDGLWRWGSAPSDSEPTSP